MAVWTDELKAQVIAAYKSKSPTAATSTEIVKEIAEEMEQTSNGVRAVLVQAGVYVKKEAETATASSTGTKASGDKAPRVSKESQIGALKAAITAKGGELDLDILDKLTGKAAAYFTKVFNA